MLGAVPTLGIGSAIGLVAIAALDPWFPGLQLGPLRLLTITAGVLVSVAVWEAAVRRTSVGRRRVLVVGTDDLSESMASELRRTGVRDISLVAHVADGETDRYDAEVPLLGRLAELGPIVEAQQPDLVVLTDEETYADAVDRLLDVPEPDFRVVGLAGFFEYVFGRVPIEQITPAWFMSLLHLRQPVYARWTKRAFDVVVAAGRLVLTAPLLVRWHSRSKLTRARSSTARPGSASAADRFTIYKFRTMGADAEADGARLRARRRSPGDMRRPLPAADASRRASSALERAQGRHVDRRPAARAARVRRRCSRRTCRSGTGAPREARRHRLGAGAMRLRGETAKMAEKLSYDLWYLRHRSLGVDVAICVRTAWVARAPLGACRLGLRAAGRLGR